VTNVTAIREDEAGSYVKTLWWALGHTIRTRRSLALLSVDVGECRAPSNSAMRIRFKATNRTTRDALRQSDLRQCRRPSIPHDMPKNWYCTLLANPVQATRAPALPVRHALRLTSFALTSFALTSFDAIRGRRTLRAAVFITSAITAPSLDTL
jgi:hypothetical protein